MRKVIIFGLTILCAFGIVGCGQPQEQNKQVSQDELLSLVRDTPAPVTATENSEEKIEEIFSTQEQESSESDPQEVSSENNVAVTTVEVPVETTADQETNTQVQEDPEGVSYYYEDWNDFWNDGGPGLTAQSGVNYHEGRTETYYSSNVLYHYRTDEWTVDEEGFYHDEAGNYVVAASDMPQGTTFEGSKGTCVVLDSGCSEGITDYYVNW
jgi:hypothetical protein